MGFRVYRVVRQRWVQLQSGASCWRRSCGTASGAGSLKSEYRAIEDKLEHACLPREPNTP